MKNKIQTIKQFKNIPAYSVFEDYLTSPDLFDPYIVNYSVFHKGNDVVIPGEYVCIFQDDSSIVSIEKVSVNKKEYNGLKDALKTALELLKSAEEQLYNNWLILEQNDYKTFLENNGIIINNRKKLCKDCGTREATHAPYCDQCTWGHEPGY